MLKTVRNRFRTAAGLVVGAVLLAAAPALAQNATGSNSQEESTARTELRRDPDRRICVREQLTGTRVHQTICKTQREWEAEAGGRD